MRKNGFKTEVRGLVSRPMLSPEHALILRLRWGGGNFLVGLPQIPAKKIACCYKRTIVESIVKEAIFTQACKNFTRLSVCCLITRQRSWFKFHRITRGSYSYWKRLISPYSDKALHEFHTCMQTNTTEAGKVEKTDPRSADSPLTPLLGLPYGLLHGLLHGLP